MTRHSDQGRAAAALSDLRRDFPQFVFSGVEHAGQYGITAERREPHTLLMLDDLPSPMCCYVRLKAMCLLASR